MQSLQVAPDYRRKAWNLYSTDSQGIIVSTPSPKCASTVLAFCASTSLHQHGPELPQPPQPPDASLNLTTSLNTLWEPHEPPSPSRASVHKKLSPIWHLSLNRIQTDLHAGCNSQSPHCNPKTCPWASTSAIHVATELQHPAQCSALDLNLPPLSSHSSPIWQPSLVLVLSSTPCMPSRPATAETTPHQKL